MNEEIREEWNSYFMYVLSYENTESGQAGLQYVCDITSCLYLFLLPSKV